MSFEPWIRSPENSVDRSGYELIPNISSVLQASLHNDVRNASIVAVYINLWISFVRSHLVFVPFIENFPMYIYVWVHSSHVCSCGNGSKCSFHSQWPLAWRVSQVSTRRRGRVLYCCPAKPLANPDQILPGPSGVSLYVICSCLLIPTHPTLGLRYLSLRTACISVQLLFPYI